jgi:hypothetical protein
MVSAAISTPRPDALMIDPMDFANMRANGGDIPSQPTPGVYFERLRQ